MTVYGNQPAGTYHAKHIVNVSGGMASAVCLFRVLERFGKEDTLAVFADTNSEDADLYRFLDDVERVADFPIHRLNDGRDIWDVFGMSFMFHTMGNGCKASWELKKKPLQRFHAEHSKPGETTIYIGFGPDEYLRKRRLADSLPEWTFDFPLGWYPALPSRCDLMADLRARGIEPPSLYLSGYPHNNCAGACILAGIKQWAGLLHDNPELYRRYEEKEQGFLAELRRRGRVEVTILKDRRGGELRTFSLRQLREEIEAGRKIPDSWRKSTCSCMGRLFA
jgi:hypothetical protein